MAMAVSGRVVAALKRRRKDMKISASTGKIETISSTSRPFANLLNKPTSNAKPPIVKKRPVVKASKLPVCATSTQNIVVPEIPAGVPDIDADERNHLNEPVYAEDIMAYLRCLEQKFRIPERHLEGNLVNVNMRAIVTDWLLEVQDYLKMKPETFHLAVAFLDTFLSRRHLQVNKLQLLAATCLFVAAKYVERFAPEVAELVRLTGGGYIPRQILRMENLLIKVLDFELYMPEPTVFLDRFLKIEGNSFRMTHVSRYLLDLTATDADLVSMLPSQKAAAVLCLARHLLAANGTGSAKWTPSLTHYTGYAHEVLLPVMRKILQLLIDLPTSKQQGARKKYSSRSRYDCVAKWPCMENQDSLLSVKQTLAKTVRSRQISRANIESYRDRREA